MRSTKAEVSHEVLPDRACQGPTRMGARGTAKMRWGDPGYFHGRPGSVREQTWVCPRADMGLFFGCPNSMNFFKKTQKNTGFFQKKTLSLRAFFIHISNLFKV